DQPQDRPRVQPERTRALVRVLEPLAMQPVQRSGWFGKERRTQVDPGPCAHSHEPLLLQAPVRRRRRLAVHMLCLGDLPDAGEPLARTPVPEVQARDDALAQLPEDDRSGDLLSCHGRLPSGDGCETLGRMQERFQAARATRCLAILVTLLVNMTSAL